jgi:hypothetical protein
MILANVCTQVVFKSNGTGYAGLLGNDQRPFTWQQHATALTIKYEREESRLKGGIYQVKFALQPARNGSPGYSRLELSKTLGFTELLEESVR